MRSRSGTITSNTAHSHTGKCSTFAGEVASRNSDHPHAAAPTIVVSTQERWLELTERWQLELHHRRLAPVPSGVNPDGTGLRS